MINTHTTNYNKKIVVFAFATLLLQTISLKASMTLSTTQDITTLATTGTDTTETLTSINNDLNYLADLFTNGMAYEIAGVNDGYHDCILSICTGHNAVPMAPQSMLTDTLGTGFDTTKDSLVALSNAIATIDLSSSQIEGAGFNSTKNSLVAITNAIKTVGSSPLATGVQVLDIEGAGFNSTNNSLAAIANAIGAISHVDLTPIEGAGFDTTQNSLVAITNDITRLGTTTLATNSDLTSAVAPLVKKAQVNDAVALLVNTTQLNNAINPLVTLSQVTTITDQLTTSDTVATAVNPLATTTQLTDAINPLALSDQATNIEGTNFSSPNSLVGITTAIGNIQTLNLAPIEGAQFNTNTNSLVAITNDILALGNSALATNTDLTSAVGPLLTQSNLTTSTNLLTTSDQLAHAINPLVTLDQVTKAVALLPTSDQLNSAVAQLTTSTQFNSAVNSLATTTQLTTINSTLSTIQNIVGLIITQQKIDPLSQVNSAANYNAALTTLVTSNDTKTVALLQKYNNNLVSLQAKISTALTDASQSYTNTSAAITVLGGTITSFNSLAAQWAADNSGPSSQYSAAEIACALLQLNASLSYLLSQQAQK